MRRHDREVTDKALIESVLNECEVIRLGFADGGEPYVVPVNFGWEEVDGTVVFYCHGAGEGKKIDLIKKLGKVWFEMDTDHLRYGNEGDACSYAYRYKCVMGMARAEIMSSEADKIHGLDVLMEKFTPGKKYEYGPRMLKAASVIKLTVEEMSCKFHA